MSPKRPSTSVNNRDIISNRDTIIEENPDVNYDRNNWSGTHENMIAPPSMDKKLETSGDRFNSSYGPSTDRERFDRDSYVRDQPDSFHQQSRVHVRESLKSSEDIDFRNTAQPQMYRPGERISER